MAQRAGRGKGGFVYLIMLVLMGILLLAGIFVHASYRQHGRLTSRLGSEEVAYCVARASVHQLVHAARAATRAEAMYEHFDPDRGRLAHVLLNEAGKLEQMSTKWQEDGETPRNTLEQLFGEKNLAPIDDVLKDYPGIDLALTLRVETQEVGQRDHYVDPVKKDVVLHIKAVCTYRQTRRSFTAHHFIVVRSLLPPVVTKFTFFGPGIKSDGLNTHAAKGDGKASSGLHPCLLFHGPVKEEKDEQGSKEDDSENRTGNERWDTVAKGIRKKNTDRGFVFLGSSLPVVVKLEGGPAPYGEHHLLWQIDQKSHSSVSMPLARDLAIQPASLKELEFVSPQAPDRRMRAWVRGVFWGYHEGMDARQLLGLGNGGDRASALRLFGNAEEPSPTLVCGNTYMGYATFTNMNVDRDDTANDEAAQGQIDGRAEARESIDPFLRNASQGDFEIEVQKERSGQAPPYTALSPIASAGLPDFQVLNLHDDRPSEASFSPLLLPDANFRYHSLFESYEDYGRAMSKADRVPFNLANLLANCDPDEAFSLLEKKSFGTDWKTDETYADLIVEAPPIPMRSALSSMISTAKEVLHYDGEQSSASSLASFDPLHYQSKHVFVKDQEEFERRFLTGGLLDLEGLCVHVFNSRTKKSELVFEAPLTLAARSGGAIVVDSFKSEGIAQSKDPSEISPILIDTTRLILSPSEQAHQAIFRTKSIETGGVAQPKDGKVDLIHGCLLWKGQGFESRRRRLEIHYDPRLDPGGEAASHLYRISHISCSPSGVALSRGYRE